MGKKKKKAKNLAEIAKGKLKETAGKTSGDSHLEAEGNVDQMRGHVKQAGEKVKDALKE
jgi:uncharacterized protein YjbJ (UPF0337 family)